MYSISDELNAHATSSKRPHLHRGISSEVEGDAATELDSTWTSQLDVDELGVNQLLALDWSLDSDTCSNWASRSLAAWACTKHTSTHSSGDGSDAILPVAS